MKTESDIRDKVRSLVRPVNDNRTPQYQSDLIKVIYALIALLAVAFFMKG